MRTTRGTGLACALVLAAAAATACGDSVPVPAVTSAPTPVAPTPSATSASPTSQPPRPSVSVTTATPTPSATTTSTPTATRTATPTRSRPTTTPVASATASATVAAGRWPPALGEPAQGDPVWAVFLAVAHSVSDPAIDAALADASEVGYTAVPGDVACDQGALEALRLDQYDLWTAATLYFATQADARAFVASYRASGRSVVGTVQVTLGCLD